MRGPVAIHRGPPVATNASWDVAQPNRPVVWVSSQRAIQCHIVRGACLLLAWMRLERQ